jgi:hypothetical protein
MKNLIRMIFFVSILVLAYYLLKPSIPERTLIGQVEKIEDKEPVGKTPNQETIEAKIKTSELDKKTPPLTEKVPATEAFSNTETGKNLSKLADLMRTLDNPTSIKGKEAWNKLNILKQVPDKTLSEIKNALPKIEDKDETKKQFFIQFASGLETDKDKRLELLTEELNRSIDNSQLSNNIQAQMTPSIIFETYIKTANDNTMAEELLISILPKSSPQIQRTLLSSFNKINPKRTDELIEEYGLNK